MLPEGSETHPPIAAKNIGAGIEELSPDERAFLKPFLPPDACGASATETQRIPNPKGDDLPFVTLTYACSLDSRIALAPGLRTTLSGPETKNMTQYLRLRHDAILIGARTAEVDNPGLNCRYPDASLDDQPRPVIVGSFSPHVPHPGKKVCRLAADGLGKTPWVVVRAWSPEQSPLSGSNVEHIIVHEKLNADTNDSDGSHSNMDWTAILRSLKSKGINSVMIEGGANVINTLLGLPDLIDAVIITIAPTFLGESGVAIAPASRRASASGVQVNAAWLRDTSWRQFGADVVVCGTMDKF